jgi:hypothetical protein
VEKIITCPNCGQKNRIPDIAIDEAKCSKCWKIIYKNPQSEKNNKGSSLSFSSIFWVVIGVTFLYFWLIPSNPSSTNSSHSSQEKPAKSVFNQPAQALPFSGEINSLTSKRKVAPLSINTSSGSNYLVKLKDAYTKESVMTIFIRGGDSVEVLVPLGSYEITYASGKSWYGYDHLFGPDTTYNKAESLFTFSDTGYQINGYTITLYSVSNGNLKTTNINSSGF